jgi:hypothetical protein
MRTSRIEKRLIRPTIWLASLIALVIAGSSNSDAGTRKAALINARGAAAQQEKPITLRYYGGPKYPMYSE